MLNRARACDFACQQIQADDIEIYSGYTRYTRTWMRRTHREIDHPKFEISRIMRHPFDNDYSKVYGKVFTLLFCVMNPHCTQILNHSPRNFQKSLYLSISDIWGQVSTYFLTLIPNHPAWRRVKMQPWGVMGEKLLLRWSRDQCSAKREKRFHFSVGLGFGIGLRLGYDSGY